VCTQNIWRIQAPCQHTSQCLNFKLNLHRLCLHGQEKSDQLSVVLRLELVLHLEALKIPTFLSVGAIKTSYECRCTPGKTPGADSVVPGPTFSHLLVPIYAGKKVGVLETFNLHVL
jgi:hypothetical protein